jgi:hypothetical protein
MQGTKKTLNLQGTGCQLEAEERAADRRVTYSDERLTITQTPLRQKRTEVTQVRRHDAPCGFPFFIPNIVASVRASQVGVQKALSAHHLLVLENATTTINHYLQSHS